MMDQILKRERREWRTSKERVVSSADRGETQGTYKGPSCWMVETAQATEGTEEMTTRRARRRERLTKLVCVEGIFPMAICDLC